MSIELELVARLAASAPGVSPETAAPRPRPCYDHVVLPGDFPDPTVTKIGDTYWASATSAEWGAVFPLFTSKNLLDWKLVGHVFPDKVPDWAGSNFWAPEFYQENGRTYVYYTARQKGGVLCVAVASADRPEGPYHDHGPLVGQAAGSIDGFAMPDENGDLYLIWKEDGNSCHQDTPIWAQRLNDERTALIGEATELFGNDVQWEGPLVEGSALVRHNGYYYMFYAGNSCCGKGCNYATGVARAKALLGPWEKYDQNPILDRNTTWKCPGHGTVTQMDGRWFLLHHAYLADSHEFVGRQGLLSEFTWNAEGWPEFERRSPQAAPLTDVARLNVDDEFEGEQLGLEWQWPIGQRPTATVSHGQLHLAADASRLGALVARRTHVATYKAATTLDFASLPPNTFAGLAAVGDPYNALALMAGNGQVQIWHVKSGKQQCLVQSFIEAPCHTLTLRLEVWGGQRYRFAYSTDGATWQPLPTDQFSLNGTFLPPWDRGVRVALVAQGTKGTAATFHNFVIRNKR